MKKALFFAILLGMMLPLFPQTQWYSINKSESVDFFPSLISSTDQETVIEFSLDGFNITDVNAPVANSKIIGIPRSGRMSVVGTPDIVQLTAPIIIPDLANMDVEVIETEYFDIQNIEIAPSKGDFSRQIDPETVPYTYGPVYQQNAWYPGKLAELSDPHILRDVRGAIAITYPFQYNPVTKVLRVYNKIVVSVKESKSAAPPVNPFHRNKAVTSIVEDFHYIYKDRYLNYNPDKYNALTERGRILVLCHDAFIPDMMPYVQWKNTIGFPTEIVGISTIGNTYTAILNLVTTYYNQPNKLTYLLIVGDNPQITTYNYGSATYSDNYFGYIAGSDSYAEVIVGRFSATTSAHVQTQVQRTIEYEKATGMATNWQTTGIGVGANEGATIGHDGGEADYVHINNIRTRLLAYNYTTVHQEYDQNAPGYTNTTAAQISSRINTGATIINYCNHGSETGWSVAGYSVTHVNALTNVKKLPFIWAVACVNGQFTRTQGDCFAEAWLKATDGTGEPTGALATYMSTINQAWVPPMDAQDEFNRILCELITGKIRRTFGAISTSGSMHMLDLGPTASDRLNTARTWTIFGDPSIMVRTDTPLSMNVTHPSSVAGGTTTMIVNCNVNDAFVTLTKNYEIIGTGTVSSGVANITFPAVIPSETIHVAVTAYNRIPYEADVSVMNPQFAIDAEAMTIIEPQTQINCVGISVQPEVVIRNMGINNMTSCTIYYRLNSQTEQSIPWTGNLMSMATDTVTLPTFTTVAGNHTYRFRLGAPNGGTDGNTANNEFTRNFSVLDLPVTASFAANNTDFCAFPAVVQFSNTSQNAASYLWNFGDGTTSTDENPSHEYTALGFYNVSLTASVCGNVTQTSNDFILVGAPVPVAADAEHCGPFAFTLNATGNGILGWYSDAAGNNLIQTGNSFTTPLLNNSTTYYVGSVIQNTFFGAKQNKTSVGGYYTYTESQGLVFDCTAPTILKSVKVYSGSTAAANKTISLMNGTTQLMTTTVSVPSGESRVTLNWTIPAGTNLSLKGTANNNLWRDGSTTIGYPLAAGNNISITKSTAGSPQDLNYYYYFYDWEVEEVCESAMNDVTAHVTTSPLASFTSNINASTVQFNNTSTGGNLVCQWNFGDGTTSSDLNPIHYYATPGVYNVTLSISNLCGTNTTSQQVNITITDIGEQSLTFDVYPNPATDLCLISCPEEILHIYILDIQGKSVMNDAPSDKNVTLNMAHLAQGVYYVRIITESGTALKPVQVK